MHKKKSQSKYLNVKNVIINSSASQEKKELAKQFRKNMTPAETLFWKKVKGNKLAGLHFRRQQVIIGFIADFYCHKYRLIIEIDGPIHQKRKSQDEERDRNLNENGFHILRVSNEEVEKNWENVKHLILKFISVLNLED